MVSPARIFRCYQENNPASLLNLIEDLNFHEIEIKLCELKLEKLTIDYQENILVQKQVEHFQNQFLIQQNNINNLKQKIRRLWSLAKIAALPRAGKDSRLYQVLSDEINGFEASLTDLLLDFEDFSTTWLSLR